MGAIECILEEVNGKVPVYAGTGQCRTRIVIEPSIHAQKNGADGLMIMPPYRMRPPKQAVLNHLLRIREAVPPPIMIYKVPILAGVELSPADIKKLADEDVIHAVK